MMYRGLGILRGGIVTPWAALWALTVAAACSRGGAAATDGGPLPALDAALADAPAVEVPDAGILDAGISDGSDNRGPDAGQRDGGAADAGAIDGATADAPIVRIPITGELAGMWDGASLTMRLQGTGADDQLVT